MRDEIIKRAVTAVATNDPLNGSMLNKYQEEGFSMLIILVCVVLVLGK